MASANNELKGYVKTENMILVVFLALILGFVGGVMFSVYRSSGTSMMGGQASASIPITPDQQKQLAALNERIQTDSKDIEAWTQLGHLYFDLGQSKDSIEAYEHSLALDAGRPDVWTDLGVMYRRNGEPRKAVEKFDEALKLNPTHQIALFNKGIVMLHDLNDSKGALTSWEHLLAINPDAQTPSGDKLRDIVQQLKQNPPVE